MSDEIYVFTDGSVNPQLRIGFGASLIVDNLAISADEAKELMQLKRFEDTSSTKLELQILLYTLAKLEKSKKRVIIPTLKILLVCVIGGCDLRRTNTFQRMGDQLIITNCIKSFIGISKFRIDTSFKRYV